MITRREALAGAALLPLAASVQVSAQASDDAALLAAARKEGTVLWYTTLIVNQAILPLKAAFEKKYPGVTLQFVRNDEAPTAIRLMNEAKGGRPQADIFDGLSVMETLRRAGLVAPYTPPTASQFPMQMKDKDGYWTAILLYVFAPGVNTSMVPEAERPKTYDDLLNPRWKGKMAWNPGSVAGAIGFVGAVLLSRGEVEGMRYLEALAKQDIVNIEASSRAILDQVIAGEYPMGLMCFNNHTIISALKGAPSDWLRIEPIPVAFDAVSVLKDAPHPNAARLLINFLTSQEGQTVLRAANYIPAMNGVEALAPGLKPETAGIKTTYLYPAEIDQNLARWQGVVQKLFRR
ncbi:MAG: extracellular solute-binding protein [Beijerinckiaceae bacterium]|nr:extracellular solute-binding protein [Beijerinckiaceae bacterium]